MTFAAIFAILVGVLMIGQWAFFLFTRQVPELNNAPWRIGFDEYGPMEGKPVFYFHGSPSSRLEWRIFGSDALAQELGLRVIVPDRPGMGLSDFQPGRRLSDWPSDVVALAGHLALDRFAVLGYSLGGQSEAISS